MISTFRSVALLLSLGLWFSTACSEENLLNIDTLGKEASDPSLSRVASEKNLMDQIDVKGILIVEAWNAFNAQNSDLRIDTAQMTFSGRLSNDIIATVEWLYEDPVDTIELQLAKIEWDAIQGSNFSLVAGQDLLPFAEYNQYMLSESLPYALGELYKTALGVHYHFLMGQAGLTVFKGEAESNNQNINNYILSLNFQPCKGFIAKINYLSDLQEATSFEGGIQNNVAYEAMSALNVQSQIFLGDLTLSLDLVRGLEQAQSGLLAQFRPQAIPLAWSTVASLGLSEMTTVSLTFEGSEELPSDPELRFGATLRHTLHQNFALGFELLRSEFESQNDETLATTQLEISF